MISLIIEQLLTSLQSKNFILYPKFYVRSLLNSYLYLYQHCTSFKWDLQSNENTQWYLKHDLKFCWLEVTIFILPADTSTAKTHVYISILKLYKTKQKVLKFSILVKSHIILNKINRSITVETLRRQLKLFQDFVLYFSSTIFFKSTVTIKPLKISEK